MKLDEEGDGRGDEEEEEEMEEGGGLEIPVGPQVMVPVKSQESVEAEKKVAMIRSGKTLEERQEEFKDMLLERGVCTRTHCYIMYIHVVLLLCGLCCTGFSFSRCLLFYLGQGAAQVCV